MLASLGLINVAHYEILECAALERQNSKECGWCNQWAWNENNFIIMAMEHTMLSELQSIEVDRFNYCSNKLIQVAGHLHFNLGILKLEFNFN